MREYDRKPTQEEALKLRELYGTGYYTIKGLAEMYNISATTADHIIKGERYVPFTGGGRVELPEGKHKYKRQSPKGSDHPLHVLTEEDVMEIRRKVAKGCLRGQKMKLYSEIAKTYFVAPETIASISASHTWKHLPSVKEIRIKRLVEKLRWEAERLPLKFSENDELFQLLTEAADELDKEEENPQEDSMVVCKEDFRLTPIEAVPIIKRRLKELARGAGR